MKSLIKNSLFVLFAFMFIQHIHAQKQADFKPLFKYLFNELYDFKYLGHDDKHVYYYRYFDNRQKLEIKSNEIKSGLLKLDQSIKLPKQFSSSKVFTFGLVNGQISILSMFYNSKVEKHYLFRETFNLGTGLSNKDLKKFAEIPRMSKDYLWLFRSSEDKSKHALIVYNYKKLESLGSHLFVFDQDFQFLYQKKDIIEQLQGFSIINDFFVSNDGKVYLLAKSFANEKEANNTQKVRIEYEKFKTTNIHINEQNYSYNMVVVDEDNEVEVHKFVPPFGRFIKYATVFNMGNEIFFSGIYSLNGDLNNAGIFVYKSQQNLPEEIQITNIQVFSEEFQKQYLDEHDLKLYEKSKQNKSKDLWDYHDHANIGMVSFHDGYLMFIEQTLMLKYEVSVGRGVFIYEVGYNDYIYAIYSDNEGTIKKVIKIPKKTSHIEKFLTIPDIQCSYRVVNGNLYMVFGEKNFKKPKVEKLIVYVYDRELNRKTIQIPMTEIFKFGLTTNNNWLSDNTLLATGQVSGTKIHKVMIKLNMID